MDTQAPIKSPCGGLDIYVLPDDDDAARASGWPDGLIEACTHERMCRSGRKLYVRASTWDRVMAELAPLGAMNEWSAMSIVVEKRLRRPATVWRGEPPIVESGRAYIPDNEDRAARVVAAMDRAVGLGWEAQQTLFAAVVQQLEFAQRDCGHDACQHVWKKAALDASVHCIRCGLRNDTDVQ